MAKSPLQPVRQRLRPVQSSPSGIAPSPDGAAQRLEIKWVSIDDLNGANRQTRRRDTKLIARHADQMERRGVDLPIWASRSGRIVYGHDTHAAYRLKKRATVPVIFLDDREDAELDAIGLWLGCCQADANLSPVWAYGRP